VNITHGTALRLWCWRSELACILLAADHLPLRQLLFRMCVIQIDCDSLSDNLLLPWREAKVGHGRSAAMIDGHWCFHLSAGSDGDYSPRLPHPEDVEAPNGSGRLSFSAFGSAPRQ
jgi:hypothetical protein